MIKFKEKVSRTIEQLQNQDFRAMGSFITQKRMSWLDHTLPNKPGYEHFTPRQVFELLFFENMGLERDELPVVSESPTEIVWLSTNRCTLLEACNQLVLDTRKVCRPVNEKATQSFVSRINPQLRFYRSYEEIRPHADYCREKIIRIDFDSYMRIAIQEAQLSRSKGNKGYGAVVVFEDQIIGQAHDTAITERDPSLHAEVNAIRQAVKTLDDTDLCGAVLFSTCEPCPMCASLAVWANVTTIVYGILYPRDRRIGQSEN
ncbi:MAG: nucleoside deaminase [Chloroflexi bacterium]|nr:nucleoside deaminase [Chloroflexota bacterium]